MMLSDIIIELLSKSGSSTKLTGQEKLAKFLAGKNLDDYVKCKVM